MAPPIYHVSMETSIWTLQSLDVVYVEAYFVVLQ
jgi:hypothetical protein